MISIFNETIAARLQYATFPLELIGLALALIEVRFPTTAAWLTRQIGRLASPIEALRSGQAGSDSVLERSLAVMLSRILRAGFYILTAIFLARLVYRLLAHGPDAAEIPGLIVGYVVSAIVMAVALVLLGLTVFFIVVGGSDFAQRFVAGRAIGTLGILIAGLGLLGELYQFLTQLLT